MKTSVAHVKALLEAVELFGTHSEALLSAASLNEAELERIGGWVPFPLFERLIGCALKLTGDPAFGLHWGERGSHMKYGIIAPLVANAPTLRKAIADMRRFSRLITEHVPMLFDENGKTARLYFEPPPRDSPCLYVLTELGMVGFTRMLQYFSGCEGGPLEVSFTHSKPDHSAEYTRLFGENVRFGAAFSGMTFDCVWLDRQQLNWDANLYGALQAEAERALSCALGASIAQRARSLLLRAAPDCPSMNAIARELGMSERSLRRHLSLEGESYSRLVDGALADTARRLLATLSIQEAAFELGFSSSSAFHRAFKRWTGQSPAEFRREQRANALTTESGK